jgi:hypothetical protein
MPNKEPVNLEWFFGVKWIIYKRVHYKGLFASPHIFATFHGKLPMLACPRFAQ